MSGLFEFSPRIYKPEIFVCVLIYQEFQVKFGSNYPGHCGTDAGHSCSRSAHCEEICLWGKVRNVEVNHRCCIQTRSQPRVYA